MVEKDDLVARTREEMIYFKRELLNREENFNSKFNRQPNVGVMQVIKPREKNDSSSSEPNNKSSSVGIGFGGKANGSSKPMYSVPSSGPFTPSHTHHFTPSHTHHFIPSHTHQFTPSHTHHFTPSHTHPFTPSHTHQFIPSHIPLPIHAYQFMHPFIRNVHATSDTLIHGHHIITHSYWNHHHHSRHNPSQPSLPPNTTNAINPTITPSLPSTTITIPPPPPPPLPTITITTAVTLPPPTHPPSLRWFRGRSQCRGEQWHRHGHRGVLHDQRQRGQHRRAGRVEWQGRAGKTGARGQCQGPAVRGANDCAISPPFSHPTKRPTTTPSHHQPLNHQPSTPTTINNTSYQHPHQHFGHPSIHSLLLRYVS